jgi:hypothetical protein
MRPHSSILLRRPAKQEDVELARDVDLHFVHRKGASLAQKVLGALPGA